MEQQHLTQTHNLFSCWEWKLMDKDQKTAFLKRYSKQILFSDDPEMSQIREELNHEICKIMEGYFYKAIYERYL